MKDNRDWMKEHEELRACLRAEKFKSGLIAIPFLLFFATLRVVLIVVRRIVEDREEAKKKPADNN